LLLCFSVCCRVFRFGVVVYLGVYRYRGIMGLCHGCDFGALSYIRDFSAYGISGSISI
jgi:hypothetical protein